MDVKPQLWPLQSKLTSPSDLSEAASGLSRSMPLHLQSAAWACGQPGAGKSTLALELVDAGFRYAGDDVALIGADGTICGIPFALTLKQGSWGLLPRLYGDWNDVTHRRSDGAEVRYLPIPDAHNGSLSPNWIIFLNRVASGPAELSSLDQLDSIKRLIEGAFAADGKLSQSGFFALKRIVAGAQSFQLTYSESAKARRLLMDLCNDKAYCGTD